MLIAVPLVTTPYLSRVLGPSQIGTYSYTYTIANYFVMFATLGMSTYGVREIAICEGDRGKRSHAFWDMYLSQLIVSVFVLFVYALYVVYIPQGGLCIALVWGLWVLSAVLDVSWLFFGVEEFKLPTIRSAISKLLSVFAIFLFVKGPEDLWIYCLSIALGFLLNQLLLWPFVFRYVSIKRPSFRNAVKHISPSLKLFVPVIAISMYVSLDKILLSAMSGTTQTGYFEYSEKLSKMPMAVITAMGTVMLPRMTHELAKGNREKAMSSLSFSVWAMLIMAFGICFGIIGISFEFAPVFLGDEFSNCSGLICVLAFVVPIVSMSNVIGRQYLLPTLRDSLYTRSVIVGAIVNILLNVVLIPIMAAMGAAIATVVAEFSVLAMQLFYTHKEIPFFSYIKDAIPYVVIGILMTAVIRVSASYFNILWGLSVQGLILEIVIGVTVFSALSVAWCVTTRDSRFFAFINEIKTKFQQRDVL